MGLVRLSIVSNLLLYLDVGMCTMADQWFLSIVGDGIRSIQKGKVYEIYILISDIEMKP